MGQLKKEWFEDAYISLTDTLNDSSHKISSGISKVSPSSIIKDEEINGLINSIKSLSSNFYLKNYADCFINEKTLDNINEDEIIKIATKNQIDEYITDILNICGNVTQEEQAASGCTKCTTTFRAASNGTTFTAARNGNNFTTSNGTTFRAATRTGNSNTGTVTNGTTFRAGSGCTNRNANSNFSKGDSSCSETCTQQGNNFRAGSGCTNTSGFATESNCGFTAASGCTNRTSSGCTNITAASGCTNQSAASGSSANVTTFTPFRAAVYGVIINE